MAIQQMMLGSGGAASSVITSNLVLHLDAGNSSSYSGSGTTWSDLTSGNHDATLIHSPTFNSSSGGGSFTFDGTNDYATIPDATDFIFGTGDFTEEVWFKRTSTTGEEIAIERGDSSSWQGTKTWSAYDPVVLAANPTHYTESTGSLDIDNQNLASALTITNDWFHYVLTRTGSTSNVTRRFHRNGVASLQSISYLSNWQPKGTSVSSDYNLHIAGADSSKRFTGEIAIIRVYNTGLSDSQITQHYNAEKARFGHS